MEVESQQIPVSGKIKVRKVNILFLSQFSFVILINFTAILILLDSYDIQLEFDIINIMSIIYMFRNGRFRTCTSKANRLPPSPL